MGLWPLVFVLCVEFKLNQSKYKDQSSKLTVLHAVGLEPTELDDGASDLQSGAFATRHTHAQEVFGFWSLVFD